MVLLVLLFIIMILCSVVSRRKQSKPVGKLMTILKSIMMQYYYNIIYAVNSVCNSMVPNPIYDGPLYESVQPQFESLVPGTAASNVKPLNHHLHDELESSTSLDSIVENSRYISQPGLIHSELFSNDDLSKMEKQLQDGGENSACTNNGMMLQSKEPMDYGLLA